MKDTSIRESDLPAELARSIDGVCNRFEAAWKALPPRVEDYLDDWTGAERLACCASWCCLTWPAGVPPGTPAALMITCRASRN